MSREITPMELFQDAITMGDHDKAFEIYKESGDDSFVKYLLDDIKRSDIAINEFEKHVDKEILCVVENAYLKKWGMIVP